MDHYEIKDIAAKVVGVGSVGTRCGILLLMADNDDALFLQVKEARTSVLELTPVKACIQTAAKELWQDRG